MKYWVGLVLMAAAAALAYQALAYRRKVIAAGGDTAGNDDPNLHNSLEMLRHIMPPLILFMLAVVAVKMTVAFVALDLGQYLSYLDLAGLLALLAAYGAWLVTKAKYRMPAPATAVARRRGAEDPAAARKPRRTAARKRSGRATSAAA